MAKKMTVQEILAAARAEKAAAAGAAPATPAETPASAAQSAAEAAPPASPPASSAAPKPAAKPGSMSVAEIMAAARAAKGGGAAPAATPKAAPKAESAAEKPKPAAKPAPAKAAAAEAAPAAKDTASILAAARKTARPGPVSKAEVAEKPEKPAGKTKLAVPPMPARPQFPVPASRAVAVGGDTTRRGFLAGVSAICGFVFGSSLAVGFTSLAVTHLMWLLGLARFMFPNILIEPPTRFKVGPPSLYAGGQVETKYIPQFGVWIVRWEYEGQPIVYALKAVCTHLGCTPNWLEAEQKFKCPCHGSGFYKDGVNFEGPAPRPLERYAISLADDGQLEVDKSRVFFQEQGQWKDPASFVSV